MKTFKRHVTHDELRRLCRRKGWTLDTSRYDAGSDWVTFGWYFEGELIPDVYSSWNGRFLVRRGNDIFSQYSTADGTPWFDALLSTLYTNRPARKSVPEQVPA